MEKQEKQQGGAGDRGAVGVIVPNAIYDCQGAAAVLCRSVRWVGQMCRQGRIKAVKSKGWRMTGAAVLAFIQGGDNMGVR